MTTLLRWYAEHLGAGFLKATKGTFGQALIKDYEAIFFAGQQFKESFNSSIELVFKTTLSTHDDRSSFLIYETLEPMLHDLARFYGWKVLDVRSITKQAISQNETIHWRDSFHVSNNMNEMLNDLLYNFLC